MKRRPNPGESKNNFIDLELMTQLLKPKSRVLSSTPVSDKADHIVIDTMLGADATVDTVKPYEVVKFHGTPHYVQESETVLTSPTAKGYHYTEPNKYSLLWGIAQDFITKTTSAPVLISGVSWVDTNALALPTANSYLQYLELFHNGTASNLRFCYNGRGTIINEPAKPFSIINLSQRLQILLGQTTSSGLTQNVAGTAFIKESPALYSLSVSTRQIPCFTDLGDIGPNKPLLLIPTTGIWYALEICP
jgi:hypothetical protein